MYMYHILKSKQVPYFDQIHTHTHWPIGSICWPSLHIYASHTLTSGTSELTDHNNTCKYWPQVHMKILTTFTSADLPLGQLQFTFTLITSLLVFLSFFWCWFRGVWFFINLCYITENIFINLLINIQTEFNILGIGMQKHIYM